MTNRITPNLWFDTEAEAVEAGNAGDVRRGRLAWATIPVMDLLERETALGSLSEYAAETRGGDSRLVLIGGEAADVPTRRDAARKAAARA